MSDNADVRKVKILISTDKEVAAMLKELAAASHRSASQWVVDAILTAYAEKNKE